MSQIDPSLIEFRDYRPADEAYVYSTWLRGLYGGNSWFGMIAKDNFFKNYHKVLDLILKNPATHVRVICLREDPDVILSYAVFEQHPDKSTLHWIYTRNAWRRMGLARSLAAPLAVTEVTHLTQLAQEIKPKEWDFNPFSI
jgi:hypothetical protein